MLKPHPQLILVGARIREIRRSQGRSQEDFALSLGIARSYYSGIERGRRNLAALNLIRIAQGLGVQVGDLFPAIDTLARSAAE